jgi:hypothetical protein
MIDERWGVPSYGTGRERRERERHHGTHQSHLRIPQERERTSIRTLYHGAVFFFVGRPSSSGHICRPKTTTETAANCRDCKGESTAVEGPNRTEPTVHRRSALCCAVLCSEVLCSAVLCCAVQVLVLTGTCTYMYLQLLALICSTAHTVF